MGFGSLWVGGCQEGFSKRGKSFFDKRAQVKRGSIKQKKKLMSVNVPPAILQPKDSCCKFYGRL